MYRSLTSLSLCFPTVLNGPPMSVKKEREAELLMARREQRSGEVICIDDWIQLLHTHTHADSVEGHLHANVNTTIPQHILANMHLQLTNEQTTLSITAALSQHLELQLLRIQQSLGSPLVISSRTHTVCAHIHTHKYFIYFPLITICPKSASHFRPIHTLTFILSLAPLDTDMKLHVCGIASHHPQWFVFRQHAPDSPRISQDRRPCIELCRLKHSAISQANPHRKLAWLFWSFRVPSTSFNLKAIFNLNALKGLKILSSFMCQTCILPWNTRYFEELFFCPYNETQWGPKQHWTSLSFIAWSENTFFRISSVL